MKYAQFELSCKALYCGLLFCEAREIMRPPIVNAGERVEDVIFTDDTISVDLVDGRRITVPLAWYPRLLHATSQQRSKWQPAGGGFGIHWPDLDEDLSVEGLLRGAPAPRPKNDTIA